MNKNEFKEALKDLTFAELTAVAADIENEKAMRVRQRASAMAMYGITLPVTSNGKRVYEDPETGARYTAGWGRPPKWYSTARNKAALLVKHG